MFQILSCSDIGTCCSSYALANFLDLSRRIINIIQLFAPIVLISAAIFQLVKMILNPEDKKGIKSITNKIVAAIVIFFVPIVFDISIGFLPDDFSLSACWESAKIAREISESSKLEYKSVSDEREKSKIFFDSDNYQKGKPKSNTGSSGGSSSASGTGGQRLVNVALGELGNNYADGSHMKYENFSGLSSSDPWCAAFVTWCAGQAGYLDKGFFPRVTNCDPTYWTNAGATFHHEGTSYIPVAGDLILYGNDYTRTHIGIVISADSSTVTTVEGNTYADGEARCAGADGCVSKHVKSRDSSKIYGYMTPKYPN